METHNYHLSCGSYLHENTHYEIMLSKHGEERLKERFGLNRKAAKNRVQKVLSHGTIISKKRHKMYGTDVFHVLYQDQDYFFSLQEHIITKKPFLLLVTAINKESPIEFEVYAHGTIKRVHRVA